MRHIGNGVVMRTQHYNSIRKVFESVWPWDYGSTRDINSQTKESLEHREAYDLLVGCIWPLGTDTKFSGLLGFPNQAPFHKDRIDVCVGQCC